MCYCGDEEDEEDGEGGVCVSAQVVVHVVLEPFLNDRVPLTEVFGQVLRIPPILGERREGGEREGGMRRKIRTRTRGRGRMRRRKRRRRRRKSDRCTSEEEGIELYRRLYERGSSRIEHHICQIISKGQNNYFCGMAFFEIPKK